MILTPCTLPAARSIPRGARRKIIRDFYDSGIECAKVDWQPYYCNYTSARSSLDYAAKDMGLDVLVVQRGRDVYLVRR